MAVIYVERSSQKGIIIGSQRSPEKVGTQAWLDIEAFFGKKISQFIRQSAKDGVIKTVS